MRLSTIICATFILFYSCSKTAKVVTINGIWESIGHGWILQISDSTTYSFYDVTSISCLPRRSANLEDLKNSLTLHNDTLSLEQGSITYHFTQTEKLPELCQHSIDNKQANDPLFNFDVFAETVKEHYAFFELNGINWEELYDSQRAKLNSNSTPAELFLVVEETFEKLNDNHAYIDAPDAIYVAIDQLLEEENEPEDIDELGDFPTAQMVVDHHLQKEMTKDSWLIHWGMITDDIGYIQLKSMWLFADLNLSQTLVDSLGFVNAFAHVRANMYEGNYMEKEVEGVQKIMDRVMADLVGTKSIIIDVRFNGGGQDLVSYEILSRFNPKKIQVAKDKFRYGNKHTTAVPVFLHPTNKAYTKPVYILCSPQSGSAAELFTLASMSLKHVKRIGSTTEGAMSTTLDKKLPIGWDFYLSNQICMDNNGKVYENIGIPVDYELNYPKERQAFFRSVVDDLKEDKQNILAAINELNRQ